MVLVDLVKAVAERKGATPAQVAFAWLLAQKPWTVPIQEPPSYIGSRNDFKQIDEAASGLKLEGARLPEVEDDRTLSASLSWEPEGTP